MSSWNCLGYNGMLTFTWSCLTGFLLTECLLRSAVIQHHKHLWCIGLSYPCSGKVEAFLHCVWEAKLTGTIPFLRSPTHVDRCSNELPAFYSDPSPRWSFWRPKSTRFAQFHWFIDASVASSLLMAKLSNIAWHEKCMMPWLELCGAVIAC